MSGVKKLCGGVESFGACKAKITNLNNLNLNNNKISSYITRDL